MLRSFSAGNLSTLQSSFDESFGGAFTAPDLRWFTPLPAFWDVLKSIVAEHRVEQFVDVGTGRGDLPREAKEFGVPMLGIDIQECPQNPEVQCRSASSMTWSPTIWPIVCRPCHNGFPYAVRRSAMLRAAGFIYVGFRKNLSRDVGSQHYARCVSKIGAEGESLYLYLGG